MIKIKGIVDISWRHTSIKDVLPKAVVMESAQRMINFQLSSFDAQMLLDLKNKIPRQELWQVDLSLCLVLIKGV